ncbi:MAG: metallophosphatase family protein [Candidatus Bathyarchaeota archaeon]|nr:metallophosphatase family protein [Candidatus Bathyarchaeota archaeon]
MGALRLLVVSDIHSNLPALRRVLEDAGRFDATICAGDIVGYGPDPVECVKAAAELGFRCVAGNHDAAVVTGNTSGFNPHAADAVAINSHLLDGESRAWLRGLSTTLTFNVEGVTVAIFHGSPYDPLNEYIFPAEAELRSTDFLDQTGADLLILGHTHVPYVHRCRRRVMVNPGSVGQPRDGDPRSSYMVIDLVEGIAAVTHRRVKYDVEAVAERMGRLGLPDMLAVRLFHGW